MLRELGAGVALHFDGWELPHTRKKDVIVGAGIFHEERAALGIAENGGGYFDVYRGALLAWCGNFMGEALRVCFARAADGAGRAMRRLRGANCFAQFHEGLIPIACGVVCE